MTFETLFLAGVIAAFGSLALALFIVAVMTRGPRPAPATVVTPAKRPEAAAAPRFDLAA